MSSLVATNLRVATFYDKQTGRYAMGVGLSGDVFYVDVLSTRKRSLIIHSLLAAAQPTRVMPTVSNL